MEFNFNQPLINKKKKIIYIHITKCAGTSIAAALKQNFKDLAPPQELWNNAPNHSFVKEYQDYLKDEFYDYTIISFVRNPYERILSLYAYWKKNRSSNLDNICIDGLNIAEATWKLDNFNDWVTFIGQNPASRHLQPQYQWLLTHQNRLPSKLFIGKVESIQEDFQRLTKTLNISTNLDHLNQSPHQDYQSIYTPQSKIIVQQRFAHDFKYFNYPTN